MLEINKSLIIASRWFLYYLTYIDDAWSNTNHVFLKEVHVSDVSLMHVAKARYKTLKQIKSIGNSSQRKLLPMIKVTTHHIQPTVSGYVVGGAFCMRLTGMAPAIGCCVETRVNFPHTSATLYAANSRPVPPPLQTQFQH